jgi:hypothetical protein
MAEDNFLIELPDSFLHLTMDRYNSLTFMEKHTHFNNGELITFYTNETSISCVRKVEGFFVELTCISNIANIQYKAYLSLEQLKQSKASEIKVNPTKSSKYRPTLDPYNDELSDLEEMDADHYNWLSKEASQEDLKEIFGEPKLMSEEEKKKQEEWIKQNSYDDIADGLPF